MTSFLWAAAPCGLVELSLDGTIVDANEKFCRWVGSDIAGLAGRSLISLLSLSVLPAWQPEASRRVRIIPLHGEGTGVPALMSWRQEGERVAVALFETAASHEEAPREPELSLISRQERRLNLLLRSAIAFADAIDETPVAEELAGVAREAYAASGAAVLLVGGSEPVRVVAGANPFEEEMRTNVFDDEAMLLRSVVAVSDLTETSLLPRAVVERFVSAGTRGLLAAPILYEGKQMGLLAVYFEHLRPFDGEAVPLAQALTRQAGQALARIELTKKIHRAAMLDEITGLPNRRLFEEQVNRFAESDDLVGVAFIDLDGFKAVNDTLGHEAGDAVLREVARRLQSVVRERDAVARFGGDEFVAVWSVHSRRDAETVAERIRAVIARPYDLPGDLSISASVGLAVSRIGQAPELADRLVRIADQAMYRAKGEGGNRVALSYGSVIESAEPVAVLSQTP